MKSTTTQQFETRTLTAAGASALSIPLPSSINSTYKIYVRSKTEGVNGFFVRAGSAETESALIIVGGGTAEYPVIYVDAGGTTVPRIYSEDAATYVVTWVRINSEA